MVEGGGVYTYFKFELISEKDSLTGFFVVPAEYPFK